MTRTAGEACARRVVCVCRGNRCRSPLLEAALRRELRQGGIDEAAVSSAGTGSWCDGKPPHPRIIEAARRHGFEVTGRARRVAPEDFTADNLLLALDGEVHRQLAGMAPAGAGARIEPVGACAPAIAPAGVPDPWGGDEADYATTVALTLRLLPCLCDLVERFLEGG